VQVPLPQLDGTAGCRHEVRIVMQDDEIMVGGCRKDLEVNRGESLVGSMFRGSPLHASDPGSCGLGDMGVRVELIEHPAVRLVLLEVPCGPQELCSLGVAAPNVAVDRCLPPLLVEPLITEHPPQGRGVHQVSIHPRNGSFSARCAASARSMSQSLASSKYRSYAAARVRRSLYTRSASATAAVLVRCPPRRLVADLGLVTRVITSTHGNPGGTVSSAAGTRGD
jgi:hypothetical protein